MNRSKSLLRERKYARIVSRSGRTYRTPFSSQNRAHISAIIEAASDFSRSLNEKIDGAFAVFENGGLPALQSKAKELIVASGKEQWKAFMRDFKLYLGIEPHEPLLDERIAELLSLLKQCDCYDHTIAAFAKQVSLSPSRLSHLFREQVGVPLKSYIVLH